MRACQLLLSLAAAEALQPQPRVVTSRRTATLGTIFGLTALVAPRANAAAGKAQLQAGYDGIQNLLTNWDRDTYKSCPETQVTLRLDCDRIADTVPRVLGLRSIEAPLFKVERTLKTILNAEDIKDIDVWTEATDQFVQHSTSAQEYAYTASFGEYNPSGGKDQVAKYMELAKTELQLARDALKQILDQIS
ncbi:hypothetical protein M885DRAFT_626481 [Pelagophyceae sp. CCMP2097]|nr:hypothetical protein M885DRAFT_626481 [Pelagophyceae sp. CCMP2097]